MALFRIPALIAIYATTGALAQDAPRTSFVVPGDVVWEGTVNGLDRDGSAPVFELAPAGDAFVYFQGLPWPRLMFRKLGEKEPKMLGRLVPFGRRHPRFAPDGNAVYFTAERHFKRRLRPGHRAGGKDPVVQTVVVRVTTDGRSVVHVAPAGLSAPDAFAVFLDLRPDGRSALVGIGNGLRRAAATRGDYALELAEISVPGDASSPTPPRRLGFQVPGHAVARYSTDGRSIYYTRQPASGPGGGAAVFQLEIAGGTHRKLDIDAFGIGTRSGKTVIVPNLRPHIGSFGFDPFTAYSFGADSSEATERFGVPAEFPGSGAAGAHPIGRTSKRLLLRTGPAYRPRLTVSSWKREAAGAESTLNTRSKGGTFPLVSELARSLGTSPTPIQNARVRWTEESQADGKTIRRTITVEEFMGGAVRIEKVTPPENPEDLPAHEIFARDARGCSFTNDLGEVSRISTRTFQTELNACSPLQLLVDPCGLRDATLEYVRVAGPKVLAKPSAIEFRHADAYHGTIHLKRVGERLLPEKIVSPAYLSRASLSRTSLSRTSLSGTGARESSGGTSRAEKVLAFDDFRPVAGRLLPHRITFDDGVSPPEKSRVMTVEEISIGR